MDNVRYPLSRDLGASARLNLQHYLWQESYGYYLHPSIPLSGVSLRVADVGTGTGIWLMDLARQFPDSMRLDGIDIDLTQCPPREWLPPNVTLRQWDVFSEVPEDLYESYDIVCVRHLNLTSRENDPTDILKNLLKLLKPGGYLQWGEWDWAHKRLVTTGPNSCAQPLKDAWENIMSLLPTAAKLTWPGELDNYFRKAQLQSIEIDARYSDPSHLTYHQVNLLMGLNDILAKLSNHIPHQKKQGARATLTKAAQINENGAAWDIRQVVVIGRKHNTGSEEVRCTPGEPTCY